MLFVDSFLPVKLALTSSPYVCHHSRSIANSASAHKAMRKVVLATITNLSWVCPVSLRHLLTSSVSARVRLGPLAIQTIVPPLQQPCKGFRVLPLFRKAQHLHALKKSVPCARADRQYRQTSADQVCHRVKFFSKLILSLCESKGANPLAILPQVLLYSEVTIQQTGRAINA